MRKRPLGATGLQVSSLGFGAGGYWGMPIFDEGVARSLVDLALDHGINLFDTGPNYSRANAEPRLGRALGRRVQDVYIATKVGSQFREGRNVRSFRQSDMQASFEQSLRNLGRDHVDLLQLHGIPGRIDNETVDFLLEQKHRGLARLVGASTGPKGGLSAVAHGSFDVLMVEYNVIHRHKEAELVRRAAEAGIGILVKSPLAQTLYSRRIWQVRSLQDLWYLARALKNMRRKMISGRAYRFLTDNGPGHDLALQFVLDHEGVSSAIIGTTRPEHLLASIEAAKHDLPDVIRRKILSIER